MSEQTPPSDHEQPRFWYFTFGAGQHGKSSIW